MNKLHISTSSTVEQRTAETERDNGGEEKRADWRIPQKPVKQDKIHPTQNAFLQVVLCDNSQLRGHLTSVKPSVHLWISDSRENDLVIGGLAANFSKYEKLYIVVGGGISSKEATYSFTYKNRT